MSKTELNKKTSEFWVTVTKSGADWKKELILAEDHLVKEVVIKGFRKGKAPRDLALSKVAKADVYSQAVSRILKPLSAEASRAIPEDLIIIGSATYRVESINDNKAELQFIYPTYPEVTLSEYKKLGVEYLEEKVNDKIIEKEIEKMAASIKPIKEVKKGPIAKKDVAKFDFEGFLDNVKFPGGTAKDFELEIGSNQFIPGFEDQMLGLKKGDTKDIKVTFPKEYHDDKMKGKAVVFKVKINEVFSQTKPELNDEKIKNLGIENVSTIVDFKKYLETVYAFEFKQKARAEFQKKAFEKILKNTKFNLPASVISQEMERVANDMKKDLEKQNMTIEQYMKLTGQTKEQISSRFRTIAEEKLNNSIIFAEIAKKEQIQVTDKDYDQEYKKLAKVYKATEDSIKGMVTKEQMQIPITNDKVLDVLIKYSKA